jgi:hypothetical protein
MIRPLSDMIYVVPAITPTAGLAAATVVSGSSLDLEVYSANRVLIVVQMGAIVSGAATSLKVESDDNTNFSSAQDITGTAQTIADTKDDTCFLVDVINPPERFLRISVSRGTQNATVSAIYLVYGTRTNVTQVAASVSGLEIHRDKPVGTA